MQLRVCGSHQTAHQVKQLNNQTHAHKAKIKCLSRKPSAALLRERDLGMELLEVKKKEKKAACAILGKEQRMKRGLSLRHNMQSVCLRGGRTA